jgi:hypothetical protein
LESLDITSELRLRLVEMAVANTEQLFQQERKAFGGSLREVQTIPQTIISRHEKTR